MKLKKLFHTWGRSAAGRTDVLISQDEQLQHKGESGGSLRGIGALRSGEKRSGLRAMRDSRRGSAPAWVGQGIRRPPLPPMAKEDPGTLLFVSPQSGFNERPIDVPQHHGPLTTPTPSSASPPVPPSETHEMPSGDVDEGTAKSRADSQDSAEGSAQLCPPHPGVHSSGLQVLPRPSPDSAASFDRGLWLGNCSSVGGAMGGGDKECWGIEGVSMGRRSGASGGGDRWRPDALGSKEEFRKEFASGLWSIRPIRLHVADVGTNTSREESGYATSSPPSSVSPHSAPASDSSGPLSGPPSDERSSESLDEPPRHPPPPPPPSDSLLHSDAHTSYERVPCREEATAVFNSFFNQATMLSPLGPRSPVSSESLSPPPPLDLRPRSSSTSRPSTGPPSPIREDVSVSSLYDRIGRLTGLVSSAGSLEERRGWEAELEQLYGQLPRGEAQPSRASGTTTLRQKKRRDPAQPQPSRDSRDSTLRRSQRMAEEDWADPNFDYIVALDIGTATTRCAFAVRGSEGVEPLLGEDGSGEIPSCLLLSPDGRFHSFGAAARRRFRDLDPAEARRHLYFESFKANIVLRGFQEPGLESCIQSASGRFVPAVDVFAHLLRHLRHLALRGIARHKASLRDPLLSSSQPLRPPDPSKVQWTLLVPFFWSQEAKNFMREAAYLGALGSASRPSQVGVALSPESSALFALRHFALPTDSETAPSTPRLGRSTRTGTLVSPRAGKAAHLHLVPGETLLLVEAGGGSISGGVFQVAEDGAALHQILPASGGPRGDLAVDLGLEILLCEVFGAAFIKEYQTSFPVTWLELLGAFSSRKAGLNPLHLSPLNLTLPASFAAAFGKTKKGGAKIASAVRKYGDPEIGYTDEGVLRLGPGVLERLFQPTVSGVVEFVEAVLGTVPVVARPSLRSLFLVGGFAASPVLQHALQRAFGKRLQVVVPSEPGWAAVRGAVVGQRSPWTVASRCSHLTFGIGVLHPFDASVHPPAKRCVKGDAVWCVDVFDPLVRQGEALRPGQTVVRRYCPATPTQREINLQLYVSEAHTPPAFVTDANVTRAAQLRIRLSDSKPDPDDGLVGKAKAGVSETAALEVEVRLVFGATELTASARQTSTGKTFPCTLNYK